MKRACLLLITVLCLFSSVTADAEFLNLPVVDNAHLLSEMEIETLSEELDEIRADYNCDVAVYIEKEMTNDDAQSTADDIYDYQGYGFGDTHDGIIFYISESPRLYHFSTCGKAQRIFNDSALIYIEENVLPKLKENDYYSAVKMYARCAKELLEMEQSGEVYVQTKVDYEKSSGVIIAFLILPLVIAFIMMQGKMKQMKTAVENNYAANYIKDESLKLTNSKDMFLYSTVIKTKIQKSTSSSGHISSSGRSHGGRGGSY